MGYRGVPIRHLCAFQNRWTNRLEGIFTQSMMISEIRQRLNQLGDLRFKSVASLTGNVTH